MGSIINNNSGTEYDSNTIHNAINQWKQPSFIFPVQNSPNSMNSVIYKMKKNSLTLWSSSSFPSLLKTELNDNEQTV